MRKVNETAFALNILETGGTVGSESHEKVEYSISSTGLASPALYSIHSVISDHQVLLSLARQHFGDCSRVVPLEVIH